MALELAAKQLPTVIAFHDRRYLVGISLEGIGPSHLVAIGAVSALARSTAEMDQEQSRLGKWERSVHARLRTARELSDRRWSQAEQDRQSVVAWEALMGLDRLHRTLQNHKEPARNRGRILRFAGELLGVSSLAWVSRLEDGEVLLEGEPLLSSWDCGQLAGHLADQGRGDQPGYVLINDVRERRWGARFPQIVNVLAVPVSDKILTGWVLAFNKQRSVRHGPNDGKHLPAHTEEDGKTLSCAGRAVPPI